MLLRVLRGLIMVFRMKWISLIITMISLTLQVNVASCASFVPGELLVKYKPEACPKNLKGELGKIGWAKIKIDKSKHINQVMMTLKKNPNIIHVEPNYYGEFLSEPNDPYFEQQWYLINIQVPDAWDKSLGRNVIIGLVDSGVDLDHEDLADNILSVGWDFGDDDNDPTDEYGHGTMVCGVIAAIQNNGLGISGIAPESKILPLKVSEENSGDFTALAVAEAIIYASDHGARVINLSLGWKDEKPQEVTEAIEYAINKKGVLLIAAAGNEHAPICFPANHSEVLAVSSTDEDDKKIYNSGFGPELDLVAPGIFILTTQLGNWYTLVPGTSLSSAMVSAVAALLAARHPYLTSTQIREYLINRADDLGDEGKDDLYGYGKVNALKTLDPLITFVFPPIILGSRNIPLPYLLAVLGDGTHFTLVNSEVSFESAHLNPLGPPLVLFPTFLLQLVILESRASEGCSNIKVTTETEEFNGYDVITIRPLPWNL